jgi:hypothetical protein
MIFLWKQIKHKEKFPIFFQQVIPVNPTAQSIGIEMLHLYSMYSPTIEKAPYGHSGQSSGRGPGRARPTLALPRIPTAS